MAAFFHKVKPGLCHFSTRWNCVFSKVMAVSLAEFSEMKLQTLQETKLNSMPAPRHRTAIHRA
jgi:hypothetical protein